MSKAVQSVTGMGESPTKQTGLVAERGCEAPWNIPLSEQTDEMGIPSGSWLQPHRFSPRVVSDSCEVVRYAWKDQEEFGPLLHQSLLDPCSILYVEFLL